jgi:hypothetical protein
MIIFCCIFDFDKCLIFAETHRAVGQVDHLVSQWLTSFSQGFFIYTQPMKYLATRNEMSPADLPFIWTFHKVSSLPFKNCQEGGQFPKGS